MASLFKKFYVALNGIVCGLKDKSIFIQVAIGCCVVIFGFFYSLNETEWLWILSCIFLVILMEFINTAIERICDLIDPKMNPKIKYIKDLSAGSVLLASLYAVVIGCMILKGVLR